VQDRRWWRRWRSLAWLAAPPAAWLLLLALANTPPARAALRAQAEAALGRVLPGARIEGPVRVDHRFRVSLGAVVVPARAAGAPPVLRVEQVAVSPRRLAFLRGRAEAGTVRLRGASVAPGPAGEELRALALALAPRRPAAGAAGAAPVAPPELLFSDLVVRLEGGRALGPFEGLARIAPEPVLQLRLPGGGRAEVRLFRRGEGEADLEARILGLELADPRLAAEPLGPVSPALRGRLRWDLGARSASLEDGRLSLGPGADLLVRAAARASPEPQASAEVEARGLAWAALVVALPAALRPAPGAPRLTGQLSFRLSAQGPLARPAEWRFDGALELSGLRPDGPALQARAFDHRTPGFAGPPRTLRVGPENARFVPLDDLPRHVVGAITLSEDAGFFAHRGFDFAEIREALAERAGAGRLRGASTITQQLAKNLFLGDDRTLARKVREALATVALEASLGKRRLLEIYLNVIEWGPGVFGIGEAAWHYFGKQARDLSPKEAAFLASIIPNPTRYHAYRARGALTPAWEERVRGVLARMHAHDVIGADDFLRAAAEPLVFSGG